MTLKPMRNPYGYRNLLVYKKADELQSLCAQATSHFPKSKTAVALADQMNRSARSTKQNITEGWKRNSTMEYYEFLGYAVASNAELEEDFTDIWKGHYPELVGLKGLMGERGEMGDIEKIPFYPLNPSFPFIVQLKLRAKELNYLLENLQKSLVAKMGENHTLPTSERIRLSEQREKDFDHWVLEQKKKENEV